jgi:hypothetical protein
LRPCLAKLGQLGSILVSPHRCIIARDLEMELNTDNVAAPKHLIAAIVTLDK